MIIKWIYCIIRLNAFAAAYRLYELFVKHTHVMIKKHIHML